MPRPIWTGTIAFGLVSVPVKLYPAVAPKDISFHQIDEASGARIKYKRVSAKTGREVPYEKIAKGYELSDDRYVVLSKEELAAADAKKTKQIEISDFVAMEEIDPIFYESTYYLAPAAGGQKAYALLVKALEETERVGIGKVVLRTKEYLAAVRPRDGVLCMETMLFPDEIVKPQSIDAIPDRRARVDERELKMAKHLIDSMTVEFDPERYKDEYRARVMALIRKKAKGRTIEIEEGVEERPQVADLLEALKRSVEETGKGETKKRRSRRTRAA